MFRQRPVSPFGGCSAQNGILSLPFSTVHLQKQSRSQVKDGSTDKTNFIYITVLAEKLQIKPLLSAIMRSYKVHISLSRAQVLFHAYAPAIYHSVVAAEPHGGGCPVTW